MSSSSSPTRVSPATEPSPTDQSSSYELIQSTFAGFINSTSAWHSDGNLLLQLVAQYGGVTPADLYVQGALPGATSPKGGVNELQMSVYPTNQKSQSLNRFGDGGGTAHTLTENQIAAIKSIMVYGTTKLGSPPRLGQIQFNMDDGTTITVGNQTDVGPWTIDVPDGAVLLGLTGDSGTMVDGIACIFGVSATVD